MHIPLVIILVVVAAIWDIKTQKIPNYLTFPSWGIGIIYHMSQNGIDGLIFSIKGLFLGMALLLFFYVLKGMGAGDVKLMGAVGALLGWEGVLKAFFFSAIIGGIYSIIVILRAHILREFLKNIWFTLKDLFLTHSFVYVPVNPKLKLHYGLAIAIGTIVSLWLGDL